MTATHTRTHVYITWANPYIQCDQCGQWVTGWHDLDRCGCDENYCWLEPCGHNAEATNVCPSWGPVDGCSCQQHLGRVDHGHPDRKETP